MRKITSVLVLVTLLIFSVVVPLASAQDAEEFDWRQFEGTTIRVLLPNLSWTDFLQEKLPEFEALTGINVNLETFVEDQLRQRLTIEMTAGGSEIDVFGSMTVQEGLKYHQAGWYRPLDEFLGNEALNDPNFELEDFTDGSIEIATVNDDLVGIPTFADAQILYYRKSVLEEAGIEVPRTLEELEAAFEALNDPANNFYAWINRGKGAQATSQFSAFLYSMGGSWLDEEGQPAMNTPEAIEALEWWGEMLRSYGPPGAVNNSWPENLQLFGSGQGALWTESAQAAATVLDPEQSQVADDVGFGVVPGGVEGPQPYIYGWILSISPNAPNPEAAWLFIQWATGKDMALDALLRGIPAARTSAWADPTFAENDPYPELTTTMQETLSVGMPYMNPPIVDVQPFRDIVGQVIVTSIEGGDVVAAADAAQEQLEALLATQ